MSIIKVVINFKGDIQMLIIKDDLYSKVKWRHEYIMKLNVTKKCILNLQKSSTYPNIFLSKEI